MHVGGLQLFEPPEGSGPDFIRDIYTRRSSRTTTSSRRSASIPAGCSAASPTSPGRSTTTSTSTTTCAARRCRGPGRVRELLELTSRLHGTLLDRHRPLWEASLVEGLDDGRFAVYTKIHHSLLDGVSALSAHDARRCRRIPTTRDPGAVDPRAAAAAGARNQAGRGLPCSRSPAAIGSVASLAPSDAVARQGRAAGTATDAAVPRAARRCSTCRSAERAVRGAVLADRADPRRSRTRPASPSTTSCWRCAPARCAPT